MNRAKMILMFSLSARLRQLPAWVPGALGILLGTVYFAAFARRGWVPHDEGYLAHAAERVLGGELPHVDFDELYVGGLTFLHAAAMAVLGTSLLSLRLCVLGFGAAFLAAFWWISRRFLSPWAAAAAVLGCAAWSLPNYFASMPSWYNLFFATWAVAFLLQHLRDSKLRWVVLAGVMAGLSTIVKQTGLYLVAASVFALLYNEQRLSSRQEPASREKRRSLLFPLLKAVMTVSLGSVLVLLVGSQLSVMSVLHFVIPAVALGGTLLALEIRAGSGPAGPRLCRLGLLLGAFGAGFVPVILFFALPFARAGQLGGMLTHLAAGPRIMLGSSGVELPEALTLVLVLPYAMILLFVRSAPSRLEWGLTAALALAGAKVLLACGGNALVYQAVTWCFRPLVPLAVIQGCRWLLGSRETSSSPRAAEMFLLLSATAFVSLVQFPLAYPIYFVYVAPLAGLVLAVLVVSEPGAPRRLHALGFVLALLFAIIYMNRCDFMGLWFQFKPRAEMAPFGFERAGIDVDEASRAAYRRVCELVSEHARGDTIYAAVGGGEVYFLCGKRNPTRAIVAEFNPPADPGAFARSLPERGINVVVLNLSPVPPQMRPDRVLEEALRAQYPFGEIVAPSFFQTSHTMFWVGWRER